MPMHTEVCIGVDIAHFPSLMYGFIMQQEAIQNSISENTIGAPLAPQKARKLKVIVLYTITNMCIIVMHSYDELDITFAIFNVRLSSSKYLHSIFRLKHHKTWERQKRKPCRTHFS